MDIFSSLLCQLAPCNMVLPKIISSVADDNAPQWSYSEIYKAYQIWSLAALPNFCFPEAKDETVIINRTLKILHSVDGEERNSSKGNSPEILVLSISVRKANILKCIFFFCLQRHLQTSIGKKDLLVFAKSRKSMASFTAVNFQNLIFRETEHHQ